MMPKYVNTEDRVRFLKSLYNNFPAKVVKVHDGDTFTIEADILPFRCPVRLINIDAPELMDFGGPEAREALRNLIEGEEVYIILGNENHIDKWGRLLADAESNGLRMAEIMEITGHAVPFDRRKEGLFPRLEVLIPDWEKELNKWLTV